MNSINKPIYKLRFFFDYNCGGCLWVGNKAAYDKFDVGCLDSEIIDLKGAISSKAKIILPPAIRNKVIDLDNRYSQSLNWNNQEVNHYGTNLLGKCFIWKLKHSTKKSL